jgi:hypothetical protein
MMSPYMPVMPMSVAPPQVDFMAQEEPPVQVVQNPYMMPDWSMMGAPMF